jgi:ComF family protein
VLEPPADDLVHALKYEGWTQLADLMGGAVQGLVERPRAELPAGDPELRAPRPRVVVPVPTTARRLKQRGYNQAELLARRVAQAQGLPLAHAIVRVGEGSSQTRLAPTERRENVRGAFAGVPSAAPRVAGADVFLVDDVLTTGATASEAAVALAALGASEVTLLAYARAVPAGPRRQS